MIGHCSVDVLLEMHSDVGDKRHAILRFMWDLSKLTTHRIAKDRQIMIFAEPDSGDQIHTYTVIPCMSHVCLIHNTTLGKSTLERLLRQVFPGMTFNVNSESSKTFSASAFLDKPQDAIWVDPEFVSDTARGYHANDLNMLLEGSMHKAVSRKNRSQIVSI